MYCKGLTKIDLLEMGIIDVKQDNEDWIIQRFWYKGNCKKKSLYTIKISPAVRKHKYTDNKVYPIISFNARGRGHYSITLSRLIFVWFNDDLKDGEVVDHINNQSYDNRPENLQKLSVTENLEKRFIDNPNCWTNQYGKPKGWSK